MSGFFDTNRCERSPDSGGYSRRAGRALFLLALGFCWSRAAAPGERPDLVVARDGSGHFTTIQAALDSVPAGAARNWFVYIKNGLYEEKIHITKSNISLAGEDRDSTRIVYPELRERWKGGHGGSDRGSGVVNIDTGVADVTIANMTIYNNYGSLTGAYNAHQFAIRGAGTRIMLIGCNVISDGGDAVSLWNRENGMYYHTECYFEGWVDFVCPRGWCYISNSRFFGHNRPSASIWHDGSADSSQKFVIVNSSFDGVSGFPLGRNHLDAQFYLVGCRFSANMADRPFTRPPSSPRPWKWGDRHYFHGCRRDGGDFAWFADNLHMAYGSPSPGEITAKWTFDGRWDPESSLPAILPRAYHPGPRPGELNAAPGSVRLSWVGARNARAHRLWFGKEDPLALIGETGGNSHEVAGLEPATSYYWRVDAVTDSGIVEGDVWTFRTAPAEDATITVRNILPSPREREPVVIPWERLTGLTGAAVPDELTITDPSGSEVVFQADDLDADGTPDEAVFMTGLGPFEERRFSVARSVPHPPRPAVSATDARNYKRLNGRSVSVDDDRQPGSARDRKSYRFDGAGWESNLAAYRLYLDGRNAVDVQGKRKPGLYWKWIGESGVDYQLDADWGTDVLHVGAALGVGGIGFLVNDTLSRPWTVDTQRCRIVARGPVRSVVRVDYTGWKVGDEKTDVVSVFTIYAGERITEHRVTVSAPLGHRLATGIVRHDSTTTAWDPEAGVLTTSGLQTRAGDSLMLALAVPPGRAIGRQTGESDELLVLETPPGETVPIMIGACWQGGGGGEWNEMTSGWMLAKLAGRVQSPPVVELRRGAGGIDLKGERR